MTDNDATFSTLDELAEADYWRLKHSAYRNISASEKAWHASGYRHGYRDAIRQTSKVAGVWLPLFRRIADALEDDT